MQWPAVTTTLEFGALTEVPEQRPRLLPTLKKMTPFQRDSAAVGSLTSPNAELAEYYDWLEQNWGFRRQTIQTDYHFASVDEAVARTEFFFGPELAARIRELGWARLPEWTGLWSKAN